MTIHEINWEKTELTEDMSYHLIEVLMPELLQELESSN